MRVDHGPHRRPSSASIPTTSPGQTRVNAGRDRLRLAAAAAREALVGNYRFRVSYTLSKRRGNTDGGWGSPEQLPVPRRHAPRPERGTDQRRPPAQLRDQRLGAWSRRPAGSRCRAVVRALCRHRLHRPRHQHRRRPQRHPRSIRCPPAPTPAPAPTRSRWRTRAAATAPAGPASSRSTPAWATGSARGVAHGSTCSARCFNVTNRANFDNPTGDRLSTNFLVLDRASPGRHPADGPDRRAFRLLGRLIVDVNGLSAGFSRRRGRLLWFRIW